jgi:hypothetical protein
MSIGIYAKYGKTNGKNTGLWFLKSVTTVFCGLLFDQVYRVNEPLILMAALQI